MEQLEIFLTEPFLENPSCVKTFLESLKTGKNPLLSEDMVLEISINVKILKFQKPEN